MPTSRQLQAESDRQLLEEKVKYKFTSQPGKPDSAMYIDYCYWAHLTAQERAIVIAEIVDLAPRGCLVIWRNPPEVQRPITSAVNEGES